MENSNQDLVRKKNERKVSEKETKRSPLPKSHFSFRQFLKSVSEQKGNILQLLPQLCSNILKGLLLLVSYVLLCAICFVCRMKDDEKFAGGL